MANVAILTGRLTKDPEYYEKQNGNEVSYRANFTLAVDRRGKNDETDFPRIVVFGKQAKACNENIEKGCRVTVIGEIRTGKYTKTVGGEEMTVYTTDVMARSVEFIDFKKKDNEKKAESSPGADGADKPADVEAAPEVAPEQEPVQEAAESRDAHDGIPEGFQIVGDDEIPF